MSEVLNSFRPVFDVGQRVLVIGAAENGVVRWSRWDGNEVDYYVTWWQDEQRKGEWLRADEIRRAES
jgi:hypothetical protein